MKHKHSALFGIIDVIRLKRNRFIVETINKSCYCLSCRLQGESLFFYKDETRVLKRGDILYIPKNGSYSQKSEGEEVICFHLEAYGSVLAELTTTVTAVPEEICSLFDEAERIWREKGENYYYDCLSVLYKILSKSTIDFSHISHSSEETIRDSVNYLTANLFDAELSVEEVYRRAKVGRTRFNELFKDIYGVTPRKYIYQERVNKAKLLLKSGNYTNEEIAHLCGFSDVKYFYVVFKKVAGKTTKEYKKQP